LRDPCGVCIVWSTARAIELRYFGGLNEAEIAEALGISLATVRRDLRLAEAWLAKEMKGIGEENTFPAATDVCRSIRILVLNGIHSDSELARKSESVCSWRTRILHWWSAIRCFR
jgi:hypothetical protein